MVPTLAVGLLGGPLADAVDRRKLVLVTSCCLAAVSAALAAQAFAGLHQVWLLYVLVAVQSALGAINAPGPAAPSSRACCRPQLPAGLALNRLSFQIMLTAGPALAGAHHRRAAPGPAGCYLIDAISFARLAVRRRPAAGAAGRRPARPGRARARWPRGSASSGGARCWPARSWPT